MKFNKATDEIPRNPHSRHPKEPPSDVTYLFGPGRPPNVREKVTEDQSRVVPVAQRQEGTRVRRSNFEGGDFSTIRHPANSTDWITSDKWDRLEYRVDLENGINDCDVFCREASAHNCTLPGYLYCYRRLGTGRIFFKRYTRYMVSTVIPPLRVGLKRKWTERGIGVKLRSRDRGTTFRGPSEA